MSYLLPDEHPLDKPLGEIHECALALLLGGQKPWAMRLAEAHDAIQRYVLAKGLADDTGVIPERDDDG